MIHAVIAEDDDIMRGLVEEILSMLGWTYDSAVNGSQALAIIERAKPDVVVSDIGMPVMNGIELLRAIKSNPGLSDIQVVLLSSVEREEEARELGCDAFIAKPFPYDALLRILAEVAPAQNVD